MKYALSIGLLSLILLVGCTKKGGAGHEFGDFVGYDEATYAEDLVVDGDYAYVCGKEHGLYVFDVSDPENIEKVDSLDTNGKVWDLVINGDYAYIAVELEGLVIASLSDPASPTKVGEFTDYSVSGVAVNGNYAYLAASDGQHGALAIVDISDPGSPSLVCADTISATGTGLSSIAYNNNHIYAGDANGTLYIYDVSSPSSPVIKSTYYNAGTPGFEPWGLGITISGNTLYYSDWGAGFIVLDISNPDTAKELGVYTDNNAFYDSYIEGTTAYAANAWGGLAILDVSDPSNITADTIIKPDIEETIEKPTIHGVWVSGDYAFLADNGEQILSVIYIKR